MILPDTNILIAYFTKQEPVFTVFEQALRNQIVLISIVTASEFLIRATEEETRLFRQLFHEQEVLPVDMEVMEKTVEYRKLALRKTKRVLLLDCFVAASAYLHNATLLTYDTHDYPFPDLTIRKPEALVL